MTDIDTALTSAVDLAINQGSMSAVVAKSVTRAQLVAIIARALCGANRRECICERRRRAARWRASDQSGLCFAEIKYGEVAGTAVLALEKAGALK